MMSSISKVRHGLYAISRVCFSSNQGKIVSEADWDAWALKGLKSYSLPLKRKIRQRAERAVITVMQREGNRNALLWLPGRNDTFYHLHILESILACGFDVWAIDLRRSGR